ncbi:hypothetical protein [Acinetobacter sp. NS-4]|uniref:hypothetical protein n=1 Tax=Acinetobacter sp. NS-4 TaxID=3127956 RepID=UPI00307F2B3B
MLDAYQKLFELIDKETFFKKSIENIIYIEDSKIESKWEMLKKDLLNNDPMTIRSYGRNGRNSKLFQELYRVLFNHHSIHIDKTNNQTPTKLLKDLTPYCKKTTRLNGPKLRIMNYQVSHLFGRTKNPLLFTSPWNIAYIPKYLDPFTGHESQGDSSTEFKKIFNELLVKKFEIYLQDYNSFIEEHILGNQKLEKAIQSVKLNLDIDDKTFRAFENDARIQLSKIEL